MGGYGSGRHGWKSSTASYRQIDVRMLQRKGHLQPGAQCTICWSRNGERTASIGVRAEQGRVVLSYRYQSWGSGEWTHKEYPVSLEWTRCNFGGERAWF